MRKFAFNKIIRDKLFLFMEENEIRTYFKVLSANEFKTALKQKMKEEVEELNEASTREEILEELADIAEIMDAISRNYKISFKELIKRKREKYAEKGGFKEKKLLHYIEVPNDSTARLYYLNKPHKYREI